MDAALESDRLLKVLLETPGHLSVSPQLYFYVLTRHMLRSFDRDVADYIANVLTEFVNAQHSGAPGHPVLAEGGKIPYLTDLLIALKSATPEREFMIRVQIGNHSLFFSGIFPQHIAQRSQHKAAPPISFYDEVGSSNYRLAANHRLARRGGLADIFQTMADNFTDVRVGLNRVAEQLLCLEPTGGLTT
jgi:hypothetical protein